MTPLPLAPPFLGQDPLLRQLQQALTTERRVALSPPEQQRTVFGWGLTRCCEELIQHQPAQQRVIRLNAHSDLEWRLSLLRTANELELRARFARKPGDPLVGVRRWLRQHSDWVLFIDDVEDVERVDELIAPLQHGRVILTLHQSAVLPTGWQSVHRLTPLNTTQSSQFTRALLSAAGQSIDDDDLDDLVSSLDGNPAALELVARHLIHAGSTQPVMQALKRRLSLERPFDDVISGAVIEASQHDLVATDYHIAWGPRQLQQDCPWLPGLQTVPRCLRDQLQRQSLGTAESEDRVLQWASTLPSTNECQPPDVPASELLQMDQLASSLLDAGLINSTSRDITLNAATAARRVGALQRGAELCQLLAQRLSPNPGDSSVDLADVYLLESRCQLDGERFAHARRSLRRALEHLGQRPLEAADALMDIIEIDLNENRISGAARRLDQVSMLHRQLRADEDELRRSRRLFLRGAILAAQRKHPESIRILERSLELRLPLLPEDHPDNLKTLAILTRSAFAAGEPELAERFARRDLEIRRRSQQVTDAELAVPLHSLADLLYSRGKYQEAESLYDEALLIREQLYLPTDRRISETLGRLAVLKAIRGAYRESDPLFRQALQATEDLYGPDHPAVARVLNDLAESLFAQAKYDQARRTLDRALRIQVAALRPTDQSLGRTRNNLAAIYVALAKFDIAQRLYEEDLKAKRESLPPVHPWTATTLNNLGEVLRSQGKLSAAQPLLEEALQMREQLFGTDHPVVAQSLSNIGYVHLLQLHCDEAADHFRRALAIRDSSLGTDHPHRANSLTCLAQTYTYQGHLEEAHAKYNEALEIARKVYGESHQQTALLMAKIGRLALKRGQRARGELALLKSKAVLEKEVGANHRFFGEALLGLGQLYQQEKKYDQAFPLLERALAILRQTAVNQRFELGETLLLLAQNLYARGVLEEAYHRVCESHEIFTELLDKKHPLTRECAELFGELSIQFGDPAAAELLLQQALQDQQHALNPDSQRIARLTNCLADAKARLGKFTEAKVILQKHQELTEATVGPDSADMIPILSHLAGTLYLEENFADAVPLIERCVQLAEQHFGPDHPKTAKHLENLAGVLFLQNRFEDAEPQICRAIEILRKHHGPTAPAVQAALENYSELLRRTNRLAEASELEADLDAVRNSDSHVLDELF